MLHALSETSSEPVLDAERVAEEVAAPGSAVYKGVLYCFGGGDFSQQFMGNVFNYVQIYQP